MNGIDIIEISRIKKLIRKQRFLDRIYTNREIEYIRSKNNINSIAESAAGIFCAKEAVSKALGTGISKGLSWKDIEVLRDVLGKPYIELNSKKKEEFNLEDRFIHISISHDREKAISICNIEKIQDKLILRKNDISLKKRKLETNKGDYGKIAIIGGSEGMVGAPCLASFAALRSGSGLVYTFVPKSISEIVQIKSLENIVIPADDNGKGYFIEKSLEGIIDKLAKMDVIAIGPGIGTKYESLKFLERILELNKPIVIDADGLNLLSKNMELLNGAKNIVLTPHLMEFSRLTGIDIDLLKKDAEKEARNFVEKYNIILVLKGNKTLVLEKDKIYKNNTGNPGMATAGSGDVLTGIIASLLGQKMDGFNAVKSSVFIHGLSGNIAARKKGEYSLIASDIIDNLPDAIKMIIEDE